VCVFVWVWKIIEMVLGDHSTGGQRLGKRGSTKKMKYIAED
jgi:hypothetical protein